MNKCQWSQLGGVPTSHHRSATCFHSSLITTNRAYSPESQNSLECHTATCAWLCFTWWLESCLSTWLIKASTGKNTFAKLVSIFGDIVEWSVLFYLLTATNAMNVEPMYTNKVTMCQTGHVATDRRQYFTLATQITLTPSPTATTPKLLVLSCTVISTFQATQSSGSTVSPTTPSWALLTITVQACGDWLLRFASGIWCIWIKLRCSESWV